MIKNFKELLDAAKKQDTMKLAVAAAQDEEVLMACVEAHKLGLAEPIFTGDEAKIKEIAAEHNLDISGYKIINAPDIADAALEAVKLVSSGEADFVLKGLLDTSVILKAVLNKEVGLRTGNALSHVMLYDVAKYPKFIIHTDGGMTIAPDEDGKAAIIKNAAEVGRALGLEKIKVACLAAKEKVDPKMQATVDADALTKRGQAGEFGDDVVVYGPLAMDLAISKEAAKVKGVSSEVAGDADIFLVPTIEVGNIMGKTMSLLADSQYGGIIMGAKAPILLVSRSDTHETKLNSIALGSVIAAYQAKK